MSRTRGQAVGKLTTGAFQATGKKMEGATPQANFYKKPAMPAVKATEPLPASANPKPFVRKSLPGMRSQTAGGIPRPVPTKITAGSHQVMPHVRNSGE